MPPMPNNATPTPRPGREPSLALQAGVPAKVVQERLGHSSISITLDLYTHVVPEMQKDAAAKVGAVIFGTY